MEAWENRKPGSLAWGYGYAVVGENRRRSLKEAVKKLLDKGAEAGARRVIELHERLEEELGIDIDVLAGPTPKDY